MNREQHSGSNSHSKKKEEEINKGNSGLVFPAKKQPFARTPKGANGRRAVFK